MTAMTRVKRVCTMSAGGTPAVDDPTMWDDDGLPWTAISDMSVAPTVTRTARHVSANGIVAKGLPIGGPGTVLFAMYASVGATGVLGMEASWNQAILGIHPLPGRADARFIQYWLQHLKPNLAALMRSNTQDNLNAEQVGNFPFPWIAAEEQRVIADYLDRETARIDALIAAKRRMFGLFEERWQGILENQIQLMVVRFGSAPLKYVCREIVVGIVVTPSAWYAETGVPAIRGMNVSPGAISLDDLVYVTEEGQRLHPKSVLRTGDVVVVRTGQAGAAAVVPPELDGANCIDLVIIRLAGSYRPAFLELVLNSDWMQKHVAKHSVGTIQSHFNVGAASLVPVPIAPLDQQDSAVGALARERARIDSAVSCVARQLGLLHERRQALITAAVTGSLPIEVAA